MNLSSTDMVDFFVPEQFSTLHSFSDFSNFSSHAFSEMILHLMESSGVVRDSHGFLHASHYNSISDVQFPEYSFLVRCEKNSSKKEIKKSDIENFYKDISFRGLESGIFLSILPFSNDAKQFAKEKNILCVGKNSLGVMMRKINDTFENIIENEEDIFSYLYNFTEEYKQKRNIFYKDISEILKSDVGEILFDTSYSVKISKDTGLIFEKYKIPHKKYQKYIHIGLFVFLVSGILGIVFLSKDPELSQKLLASIIGK